MALRFERGPDPVPGEANWLELLSEEMLVNGDLEKLNRFNQKNDHRFWHLLLEAFRCVDGSKEKPRKQQLADLEHGIYAIQEHAMQNFRNTALHIRAAIKEIKKALTQLKRGCPGPALNFADKAKGELMQFTNCQRQRNQVLMRLHALLRPDHHETR